MRSQQFVLLSLGWGLLLASSIPVYAQEADTANAAPESYEATLVEVPSERTEDGTLTPAPRAEPATTEPSKENVSEGSDPYKVSLVEIPGVIREDGSVTPAPRARSENESASAAASTEGQDMTPESYDVSLIRPEGTEDEAASSTRDSDAPNQNE